MAALFQSAEDAHQHGLAVGASLAAVAVAVFSNDYCRSNTSLGVVVFKGNSRLIQEGKQIILVTAQAFDKPTSLLFAPFCIDQLLQANCQTLPDAAGARHTPP